MPYTGGAFPAARFVRWHSAIAEWLWCQTTGLSSLKFGVFLLKGEQLGEALFAVAAVRVLDRCCERGVWPEAQQRALWGRQAGLIHREQMAARLRSDS